MKWQCKMFNNKKAQTDTILLWTIVSIFVLLGAILPFIHEDFGQPVTQLESGLVKDASAQNIEASTSSVTVLGVIVSIFTIFFWTFGNIPAIIDLVVFVPMRIMFLVLLFRNLRGN